MAKIKKIDTPVHHTGEWASFTVIGDPGCDGLGATTMSIFAKALTSTASDFTIIAGDVVPFGRESFYQSACQFIESVSPAPVYAVCGNHDTEFFDHYFGLRNYALVNERALIVILDNSRRTFEPSTLDFFRNTLRELCRDTIVIIFHIPPPNGLCSNSMTEGQWESIRPLYLPYREKIACMVSAHVHSFFEDAIDGIPLLVTGGGGARLEFINEGLDRMKTFHHVLNFHWEGERLAWRHVTLDGLAYASELEDAPLKGYLTEALEKECLAHVVYRLYADDAASKGLPGIAKLFRAASDAEFNHARNHLHVLNKPGSTEENLKESLAGESFEVSTMYRQYLDYAREKSHGLAAYSFLDALEAEKIHHRLFKEALTAAGDMELSSYFTCTSCGHTFRAPHHPKNCPVCGAPADKIREVGQP